MALDPKVLAACKAAASKYKVPLTTIIGIVMTESSGIYINTVAGRLEPTVRHEGHYLYKRLTGDQRNRATKAGLASPIAGRIANPAKQADRWSKLLIPAMRINKAAEIESVSWGLGQVMGAHWKRLGFASAEALMDHARKGIAEQVDLMMRYVKEFGLVDELQRGDIRGFVRGYNGTGNVESYTASILKAIRWARSLYSTDEAEAKVVNGVVTTNPEAATAYQSMLRMGMMNDARVRDAQALLKRANLYAGEIDGDFGPTTKDAVEALQKKNKLHVDGVIGPETWGYLNAYRLDPKEKPGLPSTTEALVQTPEGRAGIATTGVFATTGTMLTSFKGDLQQFVGNMPAVGKVVFWLTVICFVIAVLGMLLPYLGKLRTRRLDKLAVRLGVHESGDVELVGAATDPDSVVPDPELPDAELSPEQDADLSLALERDLTVDPDNILDLNTATAKQLAQWAKDRDLKLPADWPRMKIAEKRQWALDTP